MASHFCAASLAELRHASGSFAGVVYGVAWFQGIRRRTDRFCRRFSSANRVGHVFQSPIRDDTWRIPLVAYDIFHTNRVRFVLTALSMTIGTAALILVVTIGLAGRQYVIKQIDGIGVNWIFAEYEIGAQRIPTVLPICSRSTI